MRDDFKAGSRRTRLLRLFISLMLFSVLLTSSCHAPTVYSWMPAGPDASWVAGTSRFLVAFAAPAIRVYHQVVSVMSSPPSEPLVTRPAAPVLTGEFEDPAVESDQDPLPTLIPDIEENTSILLPLPAQSEKMIIQKSARSIDPNRPMIALTFDDGPHVRTTPQILDILEKHRSTATFFVIGAQVSANQDLLVRIASEGHEIGNHTFSHIRLTSLTEETIFSEITRTNEVVASVTGRSPTLLRPPFGAYNQAIRESSPLPLVLWSVETLDWKHRNAQTTVQSVLSTVKDGDIVILHDIYSATVQAIRTLVPELIDRGYQLVTISEMASARGLELEPGMVISRARKTVK